ncbi:MAG: glycosyltransferase, partial [Candidatus Limnocylindrales bacterium]
DPPPPRILFAARWYPAYDDPGRGIFVADLARALGDEGLAVEVASWEPAIARAADGPADLAVTIEIARDRWAAVVGSVDAVARAARPRSWGAPGVPVVRLPAIVPTIPGVERDLLELAELQAATLVPYGEALAAVRPFALVHAHTGIPDGLAAGRLADRLGLPLLVTEHDSLIVGRLTDERLRDAYRRLLDGRRRVVAVSPSFRDDLARALAVDPQRIGVVPNPVDLAAFEPIGPGARDPDELLWVGARKASKGTDTLLRAFAIARSERPGLRLRLIGSAPTPDEEARWQDLAVELGLTEAVSFEAAADRAGVAAAMARAAVFVHPSPRETFGVVAAEALAAGLPVAATPSGGVESIVGSDGACGTIADGLGAEALAAAIGRTIDRRTGFDPAVLRARAEAFSPAAVAAATIAEYRRLLGGVEFSSVEFASTDGRPMEPSGDVAPPLVVGFRRRTTTARIAALPTGLRERLEIVTSAASAGDGGGPMGSPGGDGPGGGGPGAGTSGGGTWREVDAEAAHRAAVRAAGGPLPPAGQAGRVIRALLHPRRTVHLRRLARRRTAMIAAARRAAVVAALDERRLHGLPGDTVVALDADDVVTLGPVLDAGVRLEPLTLRSLADRWDEAR